MKVNIQVQLLLMPKERFRGVAFYAANLINALVLRSKNSYSVSFFDYGKERNNRKYLTENIDAEILRNIEIFECNTLSYKTITDANCANNPGVYNSKTYSEYTGAVSDIYHFPSPTMTPRNVDGRVVVTVHDILPILPAEVTHDKKIIPGWSEEFRSYFKNSIDYISNRKDITIIANSECTKNDLSKYVDISHDRIFVTPLGFDARTHFPLKNDLILRSMRINKPYILYVGALDARKGIDDIIDAFQMLKGKFRDLVCVLAGRYNADMLPISVREAISRSRYKDDIVFTGYISDEQKQALLSGAEIFLFPSEYEGFGLPVLEAMACGAPVITTNVSSLPEVGGEACLYVSPKKPEQLAFEAERFLNSESFRNAYIKKGLERSALFSWDKCAAETEDVYRIASGIN